MIFLIFHCTLPWIAFIPPGAAEISEPSGNLLCATAECSERARLINASLNDTADRCQDFYSYACGGWINAHSLKDGKIAFGVYDKLGQDVRETLKYVLESLSSDRNEEKAVQKLTALYKKCLDTNDNPGGFAKVLKQYGFDKWPVNNTINGSSGWNLTDFFRNAGIAVLFDLLVIQDPHNASNSIIEIRNKLIGIEEGDSLKHYKQLLTELVSSVNASYDNISLQNFADRIHDIESLLYTLSTPGKGSQPAASRASISELQRNFSNIPLLELLQREFAKFNITLNPSEEVIVNTLYYYKQLNEFLSNASSANLETLYNYAPIHNLFLVVEHESKKIRQSYAKLHMRAYKPDRDWEECYSLLTTNMPEVMEYVYINSTSSLDDRNEVLKMAEIIRETFSDTIEKVDWMNNDTKGVLRQKLKDMTLGIGYADNIMNITYLDGLYIHVPTLSNNTTLIEMLYIFLHNKYWNRLTTLREPRHSDRWKKSALDMGAFYDVLGNRIEIPGAIFRPPFFHSGLPRSLNFGGIGGVIAHEMLHAFDASAMTHKKSIADVKLDDNTKAVFENKTKCFLRQYKNASKTMWKNIDPERFEDSEENFNEKDLNYHLRKLLKSLLLHLNGVKYAKTLDDDIADNGALQMSFKAYTKVLKEECDNIDTRLKDLREFSGQQLFFVTWAMAHCRHVSRQGLLVQIGEHKHSPEQIRVNLALQNFAPFAQAFGCSEGSYMNPTDNERCTLW